MTPSSPSYMSFFIMMMMALVGSSAFTPTTSRSGKTTHLSAWSLRLPPQTSFVAGKWYDVHNPTARRTVYEKDDFLDYDHLSFDDDWLSITTESTSVKQESAPRNERESVFRRAAKWARRVRRRD